MSVMGFSFGGGPIPFWGWFVMVVTFWAFARHAEFAWQNKDVVSARQSESSMWASIRRGIGRRNSQGRTHSEASSNYRCTNDG